MKKSWKQKRSRRFLVLMAAGLLVLVLIMGGILSLTQHQTWRTDTCGPQTWAVVTTLHPGAAQPTGASFYAGSDSYLYAMSGTPPRMVWCRHLVSSNDGSSRGIRSLQQRNGQVYASMVDGSLVDVDGVSGAIRWSQPKVVSDSVSSAGNPVPVVNETAYGGYDQDVSALNTSDGSVRWRYTLPTGYIIDTSLTVSGGLVYFGAADPKLQGGVVSRVHLYAVDALTGSLRWEMIWTNNHYIDGPILVEEGRVYVLEGFDVYAFNAKTGKQLWRVGGPIDGALTYSQGLVYGSSETALKAFDAGSGSVRWSVPDHYGEPLLVQDNLLYEGYGFGQVNALNGRTGKHQWQTQVALGADAIFKHLFVVNAKLYIAARDLYLHQGIGKNIIHILNAQTGQEEYYITLATDGPAGTELSFIF